MPRPKTPDRLTTRAAYRSRLLEVLADGEWADWKEVRAQMMAEIPAPQASRMGIAVMLWNGRKRGVSYAPADLASKIEALIDSGRLRMANQFRRWLETQRWVEARGEMKTKQIRLVPGTKALFSETEGWVLER